MWWLLRPLARTPLSEPACAGRLGAYENHPCSVPKRRKMVHRSVPGFASDDTGQDAARCKEKSSGSGGIVSRDVGRFEGVSPCPGGLSDEHGSRRMSRHLPSVSGRELIRALRKAGFIVLRQKGSHVSLEKRAANGYWRTVVPLHREIRSGTMSDILNQAGLTKEELAELL